METKSDKPVVMISSTVRDLPDHRKEVMDACLRVEMFPKIRTLIMRDSSLDIRRG